MPSYGGYGGYGVRRARLTLPTARPARNTNSLAIASLVVSILGAVMLICYGVGAFVAAVGAILGHVARKQIREREESGDGMALAGVITGWIATGLGLIFLILMVVFVVWAVPAGPVPSHVQHDQLHHGG
jgi:hypothetical protein